MQNFHLNHGYSFLQSSLFSPRWLTAGPVEGHLKGERGSWACFKPTSLVFFSYSTWASGQAYFLPAIYVPAWVPKHLKRNFGLKRVVWILLEVEVRGCIVRNHESGDNIEQLQGQISRQISCKHRIWKRGKHSQSVRYVWHTRLPGEWHHWRLPDWNNHPGVRHLLPLPPSLPAHNHPHHLRSLQGWLYWYGKIIAIAGVTKSPL